MTSKAKTKHTPAKKTPAKSLKNSPVKKVNSPIWGFRTKKGGQKHRVIVFSPGKHTGKASSIVIKQINTPIINTYSQDRPVIFTMPLNDISTPIKNQNIIPIQGLTPNGTTMYPGRSFKISFGQIHTDNGALITNQDDIAWIYSPSKPKTSIEHLEDDDLPPTALFEEEDHDSEENNSIGNSSLEQSTGEDDGGGEEISSSSSPEYKIISKSISLPCPQYSHASASKRIPSQNTVMGENAKTAVVNSSEIRLKKMAQSINQEWLHLIAHSLATIANRNTPNKFNPQTEENLVASSGIDNTKMLTLELAASAFLSILPNGFTIDLETKAKIINNTNNVASYIWQHVTFKDSNNHKFITISQEFPANQTTADDKEAATTKDLDLTIEIILMAFNEVYGEDFIIQHFNLSPESDVKSSTPKFK